MAYKKKYVYRQGDVNIFKVDKLLVDDTMEPREKVIAYGEVTGHAHRISEGEALIIVDKALKEARMMSVNSDSATLTHEEHADHVFAKGDYEIKIQREYDWVTKKLRSVAD